MPRLREYAQTWKYNSEAYQPLDCKVCASSPRLSDKVIFCWSRNQRSRKFCQNGGGGMHLIASRKQLPLYIMQRWYTLRFVYTTSVFHARDLCACSRACLPEVPLGVFGTELKGLPLLCSLLWLFCPSSCGSKSTLSGAAPLKKREHLVRLVGCRIPYESPTYTHADIITRAYSKEVN